MKERINLPGGAPAGALPPAGGTPRGRWLRQAARLLPFARGLLLGAAAAVLLLFLCGRLGKAPAAPLPQGTDVPGTDAASAPETAATVTEASPAARGTEAPGTAEGSPRRTLRNESGFDAGLLPDAAEFAPGYSLAHLTLPCAEQSTPAVLIVCSHTSERVAPDVGVTEAAAKLGEALRLRGIPCAVMPAAFDGGGSLGAYAAMNDALPDLRENAPDAFLLLDLHSSDTEAPLTLTVGTGVEGMRENYLLAASVAARLPADAVVVRLVPGAVGQGSGMLSLHAGLCAADGAEAEALLEQLCGALCGILK